MSPPPPVVLAFGEFLWDVFPEGEKLGGAPANLAYHLAQLRCDARLVSAVGDDDEGMLAVVELRDKGVDVSLVSMIDEGTTGRVDISVEDSGDARFEFLEGPAWEHIEMTEAIDQSAAEAHAVVFTSLALSSDTNRSTLDELLAAADPDTLTVFDVNLRPPYSDRDEILRRANAVTLLKCNREEAVFLLGDEASDQAGGPEEILAALHQFIAAPRILMTLDADGAIYSDKESPEPVRAVPVEFDEDVIDTVGAGDSFLATVVEGICRHREISDSLERAALMASHVVRMAGAMPGYDDEMLEIANG